MRPAGTILRPTPAIWLLCLFLPISLIADGWQLGAPACLCSMTSRLLLPSCAWRTVVDICPFCLTTIQLSFLYLENFPPSRAFLTYGNKKCHTVFQAHGGNFAIPPTKRWSLRTLWICAWLCDLLWPMMRSQMWHKQRPDKYLSTEAYCCWEPCDHCVKKSGLASLRSRGHMERQSVPIFSAKGPYKWVRHPRSSSPS